MTVDEVQEWIMNKVKATKFEEPSEVHHKAEDVHGIIFAQLGSETITDEAAKKIAMAELNNGEAHI